MSEILSATSKVKTSLPYYDYFEKEIKNVFASGRKWLGEFFFNKNSIIFRIKNLIKNNIYLIFLSSYFLRIIFIFIYIPLYFV